MKIPLTELSTDGTVSLPDCPSFRQCWWMYIYIYSATTLKRINFMLYALSTFPRFMRLATNLAELK